MNKYLNNEIFDELRENIKGYLKNFLSESLIESKLNNCKYVLSTKRMNKIYVGNETKTILLNDNSGYTSIEHFKDQYNKINIKKPILFVSAKATSKEKQKQIAFHEMMHVLSTRQKVINKQKYQLKSGIYEQNIIYDKTILTFDNKLFLLNEAITELVSKYIYDQIYINKYKIKEKVGRYIYKSAYEKEYFILVFNLLNYFEKNPNILFDIYFNNNVKLLNKVLKQVQGTNLDIINSRVRDTMKKDPKTQNRYYMYLDSLQSKENLNNKDVLRQFSL